MSFLYPAMLAGVAAVSVPIIIHLLNKFQVKTTEWGAMKFLMDSVRANEKKVKIEDLILLILRCLLIALAAIAFARPVLKALAGSSASSGNAVAAVLLLDNSASMNQSAGAGTLFDEAKKQAIQWSDEQPPQSLAALSLVSTQTDVLIAKPGSDRGLFRKLLAEAPVSDRGSDLAQGVRLAIETLKPIEDQPREIRIYTDGQAKAWLKSEEIIKLASDNPGIRIIPIIVGDKKSQDNAGIVALRTDGGIAAAGQPLRFHLEVANYGASPLKNVSVSLSVDGGPPAGKQTIAQIPPGTTQATSISVAPLDAGPHTLVATLGPDAFSVDNKRSLAINVIRQMNVLIAEGNHDGPAMDRDGFFLANALVPVSADQLSRYYLAALPLSPAELPGELGNKNNSLTQAVFLCNPGPVSPAIAQALKSYVEGGGNLVIFPGPLVDVAEWKANTTFWEMLPADIWSPLEDAAGAAPLKFQAGNFTHPVTALWNDPAQGSLAAVEFNRSFPLTLRQGIASRTILSLDNGEPAIVERNYGEGHVVLFNSTATPEWNNLPLHPSFLPLIQRLMGNLNRSNEARLTLAPGEAFRMPVDETHKGKDFAVQRPGSDASRTSGQVVQDGTRNLIRYAATDLAGTYKVSIDSEVIAIFGVQMDPAESDLRLVDSAVLAELQDIKATEVTSNQTPRMVVTKEFWTTLIWIVLAFFLLEGVIAHRLSHAR